MTSFDQRQTPCEHGRLLYKSIHFLGAAPVKLPLCENARQCKPLNIKSLLQENEWRRSVLEAWEVMISQGQEWGKCNALMHRRPTLSYSKLQRGQSDWSRANAGPLSLCSKSRVRESLSPAPPGMLESVVGGGGDSSPLWLHSNQAWDIGPNCCCCLPSGHGRHKLSDQSQCIAGGQITNHSMGCLNIMWHNEWVLGSWMSPGHYGLPFWTSIFKKASVVYVCACGGCDCGSVIKCLFACRACVSVWGRERRMHVCMLKELLKL